MRINDVELYADLYEADVVDRYLAAMKKVADEANKLRKDISLTPGESIRRQCQTIFECFNSIYGEGTDKKLFGERTNLKECLSAFQQLIDETNRQKTEMEQISKAIASKANEITTGEGAN